MLTSSILPHSLLFLLNTLSGALETFVTLAPLVCHVFVQLALRVSQTLTRTRITWGACSTASSHLAGLGKGPVFCIPYSPSSDAAAAGPQTTL